MRVEPRPTKSADWSSKSSEASAQRDQFLFDLEENIVVNRGRYVGRTYRVDGLMGHVAGRGRDCPVSYDADGHMLATVNVFERVPLPGGWRLRPTTPIA